MNVAAKGSVLLIGGSGVVGLRAARALRKLQPELPIVIAGRDANRAGGVAAEIGGPTTSLVVDLERDDLGLGAGVSVSAVAVFVKDSGMRSMRYAQEKGVPYLAFSDFSFDIAPAIGLFVHEPKRAPVLLLGHVVGGTATLAALHFAKELRDVASIEITGVVGSDDTGGPAAQADFLRYAQGGHGALVLRDGHWTWLKDAASARTIVDSVGRERTAHALPLLDVVSLAAATRARSLRVDLAVRGPEEQKSATEVIIELKGTNQNASFSTIRVTLADNDVHARISAYGAALALERLLGCRGGSLVAPGLYHPESILDPSAAVERLVELGVRVEVVRSTAPRMKIGIIGSGNIGGTLTRRLTALGHDVFVANSRGPGSLDALARETGAHAVSVHEAARAGEIVILAIPEYAAARLPRDLFEGVPSDVVIVDAGNYYPRHRDGRIDAVERGKTESRWVADMLGRPVVKAYNNVWAADLLRRGRPSGAGDRFALPIAGDDPKAKAKVMALTNALGFDAVDAGGIDESWRQQPGTPVYTANLGVTGTLRALAEARNERSADLSGTAASPGSWSDPR
ncbi:MAG TPA: NAD(P)-binding domain-containing protein [Polyangiaceae bacterium]|nr:NAD(P)-binding domain-containing protein [Polyangiaceae bacterium]